MIDFDQINEELNRICNAITLGHPLAKDLRQEVLMVVLQKDSIQRLITNDYKQFKLWCYGTAYRLWNSPRSTFNYKRYDDYREVAGEDIIKLYATYASESNEDTILDYLDELPEIDQLWLREYLNNNCSISKLSRATGVTRGAISSRLKEIYAKLKSFL